MKQASTARRKFLASAGLAAAAAARPLAAYGQAVDSAPQASRPSALQITELKCGYVRGSRREGLAHHEGLM
jgi:galactonate dehydratase